jgi:hypothetical protein
MNPSEINFGIKELEAIEKYAHDRIEQLKKAIEEHSKANFEASRTEELSKLPWKDFANGNGAWIKASDAPEWLLYILRGSNQYDLEGCTYKLSGSEKQFVNRYHKKVSPDKVSITLGVETQEKTAKEAAAKNSEMMNAIINKLKALGLSTDEISTSYYNIYPVYEYPPVIYEKDIPRPQSPVLVGYRVTNTITITTSASEDVGSIIDAAVDAGANQVQGVSFFVSEEVQGQMNKQLIEQAVLDARAKAQSALSPLNMQIVGVKNINLNDVYFPVYSYDKVALEGGAAPTPILPSQQQVSASVSVTFIIGSK